VKHKPLHSKLAGLPRPLFILAPMDDVTDSAFRRVIAGCASPDIFFTEFTNVDGLQSPGRSRLLKKLKFVPGEQPPVAQIWGLSPDNFYKTAREIADGSLARELGLPDGVNFAGVDLNMGCPAKGEVKNGACSALILNRPLAAEIIKATQQGIADAGGTVPFSVKTRVGFNEVDMTWIAFLLSHNLDMLVVHGRTRKQMSKVPANWDLIGQARELRDKMGVKTLIIGNGDVKDRNHGLELAKKHGLDGIMIGRGVFHDPYVFAANDLGGSPWDAIAPADRIVLYRRHVELFQNTWQHNERPVRTLNKFCKIYVNGFDGARELRDELMAADSTEQLLQIMDSQPLITA
jgi:tRNA-dihydrouridine synthase